MRRHNSIDLHSTGCLYQSWLTVEYRAHFFNRLCHPVSCSLGVVCRAGPWGWKEGRGMACPVALGWDGPCRRQCRVGSSNYGGGRVVSLSLCLPLPKYACGRFGEWVGRAKPIPTQTQPRGHCIRGYSERHFPTTKLPNLHQSRAPQIVCGCTKSSDPA